MPPVGHMITQDRLVKSMINKHLIYGDPRELLRFGDVSKHISSALDTALDPAQLVEENWSSGHAIEAALRAAIQLKTAPTTATHPASNNSPLEVQGGAGGNDDGNADGGISDGNADDGSGGGGGGGGGEQRLLRDLDRKFLT